jgi:hypothetical protein
MAWPVPIHIDIPLPVIAKWEHILKLYQPYRPRLFHQLYKQADPHLSPTAQSSMKVNLAAVQVMSHTVVASLNVLVAIGKDHCTVCFELYFIVKEMANENMRASFQKVIVPRTQLF